VDATIHEYYGNKIPAFLANKELKILLAINLPGTDCVK